MDADSVQWVADLSTTGAVRDQALAELHALLLRIARSELGRRVGAQLAGPELDDLAFQATADAMLAILAKLREFRGESRFTTWAYRFAVLEVSSKLGRHYWSRPGAVALDVEQWDRLPDRLGVSPEQHAEGAQLTEAVRAAVTKTLTDHQRALFVAIVLNGVPLDAVVVEFGTTRNAVYKTIFDARRKIRAHLVANGYLTSDEGGAP